MEASKKINEFLKEHLSVDKSNQEVPSIESLNIARKAVLRHKKKEIDRLDIFSILANFLNLKIKLYHAVVAIGIIFACVLLVDKQKTQKQSKVNSSESTSSLVAVKNSTVLSCIQTYVSPK